MTDVDLTLTAMPIFDEVLYHLASSFSPQRKAELSNVLEANGASPEPLSTATHVITNSNRFEGWQSVGDDVAVVTVRTRADNSRLAVLTLALVG